MLLVDNGHINFVYYAIRAPDHLSCGYFEISRQQGGEADLKKYLSRSQPFKFWKPITQKVYLVLQRDIKRKEREANDKKSLTNVLPVSKRKI